MIQQQQKQEQQVVLQKVVRNLNKVPVKPSNCLISACGPGSDKYLINFYLPQANYDIPVNKPKPKRKAPVKQKKVRGLIFIALIIALIVC